MEQPPDRDARCEHEDAADEPRRGPIRELGDGRPLPGRLLGATKHPAEHGRVPGADHLDLDHSEAVDATGEHVSPGRSCDGFRLTGEQRFVECGVPGPDHTVGGDRFAGANPHPIALTQRRGGDTLGRFAGSFALETSRVSGPGLRPASGTVRGRVAGASCPYPGGDQRSGAGEGADRGGCPPASDELEVAGTAQQGDEHDHRVEPDLSLAGDRREGAAGESDREAERHRDVHRQAPAAKRRAGAGEEGASRPDQHRDRERQRKPSEEPLERGVHSSVVVARVQGDAEQHHLHPEQRGDAEPPDAGAALGFDGRLFGVRGVGSGAVSGTGEGLEQGVHTRDLRLEPHLGAPQGKVHGDAAHPRDPREQPLDQPRAPGTAHPLHGERDRVRTARGTAIAVVFAGAPHQQAFQLGNAPRLDLRPMPGVGGGGALRFGVVAQPVPGIESGVRDGHGRRAAGVAAHPHLAPGHRNAGRPGAEGCAAVVAPVLRGICNRGARLRVQRFVPGRIRPPAQSAGQPTSDAQPLTVGRTEPWYPGAVSIRSVAG